MKKLIGLTALLIVLGLTAAKAADEGHDSHNDYTKHAQLYKSVTPQQFVALPDSAPVAMMCSKCKSVMVMAKRDLVGKPGRGTVSEAMATDTCPGCGKKMVLKRGGKETEWVHSCKDCGDHSVTCCARVEGGKAEGK